MPLRIGISLLATVIVALLAFSASAQAETVSCTLYASPAGSDAASGAATAPLRSVQELADRLGPGQTGCLRSGAYPGDDDGHGFLQLKVSRPGIKLASAPGEAAEIDGRVWVAYGANGVNFENLAFNGTNSHDLPSPTVDADDTAFRNVDVSNGHTSICFALGEYEGGEIAHRTLIEGSRIHDCGEAATNQEHGIYIDAAEATVIRGNWIYDNGNRGIQLYPDAQSTTITENVIYGNGEGIIFSGNDEVASSGNLVTHNVIAASTIRSNVESFFEKGGPVGVGNEVRENCLLGGGSSYYAGSDNSGLQKPEVGFHAAANFAVMPHFANAAAGNFEVVGESPCLVPHAATATASRARSSHAHGALVLHAAQAGGRSAVDLSGTVPAEPQAETVTFEVSRGGAWRPLASRRVGKPRFRVRVALPHSLGHGRLRFRAQAAGVQPSPPVVVRVRPDRRHRPAVRISHSMAL